MLPKGCFVAPLGLASCGSSSPSPLPLIPPRVAGSQLAPNHAVQPQGLTAVSLARPHPLARVRRRLQLRPPPLGATPTRAGRPRKVTTGARGPLQPRRATMDSVGRLSLTAESGEVWNCELPEQGHGILICREFHSPLKVVKVALLVDLTTKPGTGAHLPQDKRARPHKGA
jgi:hypothetical protein